MARRKTLDDDIFRLADNLDINEGDLISDRDSFDLALDRYAPDNKLTKGNRQKVFDNIRSKRPTQISKERLHTKAGGKDLGRDRKQTAKTVVKTREEFIKRGARHVDFAGFDIKESEIRKLKLRPPKEFNIASTVKNKTVFSKKVFVTVRGKKIPRLRDQFGRFASRK